MNRDARREIARRGKEIYDRSVRAEVEPEHLGRFLAVDVESGDYEVGEAGEGALDVTSRLRERRPDAVTYLVRVGRPAAFRLGGRGIAARP